jgi:hypothetical protein
VSGLAANIGLAVLAALGLAITGVASLLWVIPSVSDPIRLFVANTGVLLLLLALLGIYFNPRRR